MASLILGTRNVKKGEELVALLAPWGFSVATLADFPALPPVVEDGETFADNARKKATELACALSRWVLGEDSGLVVPALEGRPGVLSARFAGTNAADQDNNRKLLEEFRDLPQDRRDAYYVCALVLSDPAGHPCAAAQGRCHGRIATEPRGTSGFGYDPLFLVPEYHKTFGELGPRVKHYLSHRARAVSRLLPALLALKSAGKLA